MVNDVSRAFSCAPARRHVFAELAEEDEDGDEDEEVGEDKNLEDWNEDATKRRREAKVRLEARPKVEFCRMKCGSSCCEGEVKNLDAFERAENQGVNNVDQYEGKWELLEATVDSGAADTVGPKALAEWIAIQETEASKTGLQYNAAEGSIIKKLGEKELSVVNENGIPGRITVQIGDKINKLLAAVSKIGHAGNKVTFFDDDGCHRIVNKRSGVETRMREVNGTFKMDLWVWNPKGGAKRGEDSPIGSVRQAGEVGFQRQGRH